MLNPEKEAIKNIDIEHIYQRAISLLQEEEISLDDFLDLYSPSTIEKHRKYVEQKANTFSTNKKENFGMAAIHKKIGTIFEAVFYTQAEQSNWLGPNVQTIKTSKYDDFKNGVDIVAQFSLSQIPNAYSFLGFAIDVTTSDQMAKKFIRIREEIKAGKLACIEYFISAYPDLSFKGRLSNIPRVIIGASRDTVLSLGRMWIENRKRDLAKDPIQFQILDEISLQVKKFKEYATKHAPKESKETLVNNYRQTESIIQGILKNKNQPHNPNKRDTVFEKIQQCVQNFETLTAEQI